MRADRVRSLKEEMKREAEEFIARASRRPTTPPRRCKAQPGVWEEKQQEESEQCEGNKKKELEIAHGRALLFARFTKKEEVRSTSAARAETKRRRSRSSSSSSSWDLLKKAEEQKEKEQKRNRWNRGK